MHFVESDLSGAFFVELEPASDERGFFARSFCEREFAARGLPAHFPQCNLSRNLRAGTLRGMHYELPPTHEAKLVRCTRGRVFDVIVDLREDSPTRLRWTSVELSAERANALYVPPGFAHGFMTLTDEADVFYHMADFFRPGAGRGFRWDDPRFGIHWPMVPTVMSERDRGYPDFEGVRGC